jgi:hypothetical protein
MQMIDDTTNSMDHAQFCRWFKSFDLPDFDYADAIEIDHAEALRMNEAPSLKCQSKSRATEHSNPEREPEMFTVYSKGTPSATSVQCLAHAILTEARGYRVEVIPT